MSVSRVCRSCGLHCAPVRLCRRVQLVFRPLDRILRATAGAVTTVEVPLRQCGTGSGSGCIGGSASGGAIRPGAHVPPLETVFDGDVVVPLLAASPSAVEVWPFEVTVHLSCDISNGGECRGPRCCCYIHATMRSSTTVAVTDCVCGTVCGCCRVVLCLAATVIVAVLAGYCV